MNMRTLLNPLVALTVLLLSALPSMAEEEMELCEPFRDGVVDESVLADMLAAADNGHLYRIDTASSKVGFCVDSQFKRVKGDFRDFQGGMALGRQGDGNPQTLVVIRTASLDTGGAIIENLIKSERFFDVDNYPEILFVGTGFRWTSSNTAVLKGELTLRGVTRSVVFDVTLNDIEDSRVEKGDKILVKATTTVKRSDFGMDTLSSVVSDDVSLCMSVEASQYNS